MFPCTVINVINDKLEALNKSVKLGLKQWCSIQAGMASIQLFSFFLLHIILIFHFKSLKKFMIFRASRDMITFTLK